MKKGLKITLIIFVVVIALVLGYFIGYKNAYDKIENKNQDQDQNINLIIDQQTFYAEITEITDNILYVRGLDVNDINYRGEFTFSIIEETELLWRGTKIELSELDVGDNIAITFEGEILESYPAQIKEVVKIQLLDDEK